MSEEINEGNCVLSEDELNAAREMFIFYCKADTKHWGNVDKILLKINKLNDMAKEKI